MHRWLIQSYVKYYLNIGCTFKFTKLPLSKNIKDDHALCVRLVLILNPEQGQWTGKSFFEVKLEFHRRYWDLLLGMKRNICRV